MIVNKRKLSILGHTTEQSMHILTCKQVTADIKTHGFDRTWKILGGSKSINAKIWWCTPGIHI